MTCSCGITWAAPVVWLNERRKDHKEFYCPNGCNRWFSDTREVSLKKRLSEKEACCYRLESTIQHQENVINGYKGQITKMKNKEAK